MYEYMDRDQTTATVGSFSFDKHKDFKNGVKHLLENFNTAMSMDAIDDITKILKVDTLKEDYKDKLIGDVALEKFDDPYYASLPAKLDQLFENSSYEILREASVGQLAPIVGLSLPILKKNYIECHSKDIVMTEVPTKPIVKIAIERKFLKDKAGKKYYIPDIYYSDEYKSVIDAGSGKTIVTTLFTVPQQDIAIMNLSGGSLEARDSLAYDFCINAVEIMVPDAAGTGEEAVLIEGLDIQPNMAAGNSFSYKITAQGKNSPATTVVDMITGAVDQYEGKVSVASTGGKITKVRFGGHLSNENNLNSIELDRERETKEWKIPDGSPRINTGLTVEKIKDYKALFDLDITTEIISDMSTQLTQIEDSSVMTYLDDSLARWKTKTDIPWGFDKFVESSSFSCTPPANVFVTNSQWIASELKYYLNRLIDSLKDKLKTTDIMFVVYGNPFNVSLIQDDIKWVIDEDTKVGGIQLDYSFGVMTANKNRIHVVSSLKVPKSKGLRVVAYPLSQEIITFKHFKYSLNIENVYRNPQTPLTPNVMGVSRYLTTEVWPVQGDFTLTNNNWGIQQ